MGMSEAPSPAESKRSSETSGSAYNTFMDKMKVSRVRREAYRDYEAMDLEVPEISAALDIYADNITQGETVESEGYTVVIEDAESEALKTKAEQIVERVDKLTKLPEKTWDITRDMCKFGDDFEENVVANQTLWWIKYIPAWEMRKNFDNRRRLLEFAYTQQDIANDWTVVASFREWQITNYNFRLDRKSGYGKGVLWPARKIWKQLNQMEDGMVVARLKRAQMRLAWLVDVTGMGEDQAIRYLEKIKDKNRTERIVDPNTGNISNRFDPLTDDEDLFVPMREGSSQGMKVIQGSTNLGNIKDVLYFHDKMIGATKVPKSYLAFERDVSAKAVLSGQDVQFARTIRGGQKAVARGHTKTYSVAFILAGINPVDLKWRVVFPPMGTIDELRRWQIEAIKSDIIMKFNKDFNLPTEYIYRELLQLPEDKIKEIENYVKKELGMQQDRKPRETTPIAPEAEKNPRKPAEQEEKPGTPGEKKIKQERYTRGVNYSYLAEDIRKNVELVPALEALDELVDWQVEALMAKRGKVR